MRWSWCRNVKIFKKSHMKVTCCKITPLFTSFIDQIIGEFILSFFLLGSRFRSIVSNKNIESTLSCVSIIKIEIFILFFTYVAFRTFKHVDTVIMLQKWRNVICEYKFNFTANDFQISVNKMCFPSEYFSMSTSWSAHSLSCPIKHCT